jgi:FlaA1/EpsC-like NDP-sugar epimerase
MELRRPPLALLKNKNLYLMLVGESGLFALAMVLAFLLRFEFDIPPEFFRQMLGLLPLAVVSKLVFFLFSGLYRGMWRYTGLSDLWRIGRAVFMAEVALILYVVFSAHFQGYPRSVFVLDPLLAFVFACGARVFIRSIYEFSFRPEDVFSVFLPEVFCTPGAGVPVLIVGADDVGARIAKEILEIRDPGMRIVGFADDHASRIGRRIHGLPVFGPMKEMPRIIALTKAEEVLVSAAQDGELLRQVVEACEAAQIRIKKLPALSDIVSGRVSVKALRDVRYEDLLGREEVHLDEVGIKSYLTGKVVLVTGAGGSIGSELCRQIIRFAPRKLILFDAGEENLYSIEMELLHQRGFSGYVPVLGQVQDAALIDSIFRVHRPDVVFHAAAYKHVPMLECNPWQAVANNILGSRTVMEASERHGVQRFVLVSTDKAVRPTNVMGASKRVAELMMHGFSGTRTMFMAVRFGNVLGSSGSVIPLFRDQIERGGPVTVTHRDVTRYFMTIPEAAQLIVQAGAQGRGGEVFVLKMGKPVRIADLARDLIVLSGKDPAEIEIRFTGLRPGEKLYEELITAGEDVLETGHSKIMVLRPGETTAGLDASLAGLTEAAARFDLAGVRGELKKLVSEYCPEQAGGCRTEEKNKI